MLPIGSSLDMMRASREALATVSEHIARCEAAGCDVFAMPFNGLWQVVAQDPETGRYIGLRRSLAAQNKLAGPIKEEIVVAWLDSLKARMQ